MAPQRVAGVKVCCCSNLKISPRFSPGFTTDLLSRKHSGFALFAMSLSPGGFWVTPCHPSAQCPEAPGHMLCSNPPVSSIQHPLEGTGSGRHEALGRWARGLECSSSSSSSADPPVGDTGVRCKGHAPGHWDGESAQQHGRSVSGQTRAFW
jgi:hypothetical protein